MSDDRSRGRTADLVLSAVVLAFSSLVLWGTKDLPPPRWEPLGSASLPRGIAIIMAVLALILAVRTWLAATADKEEEDGLPQQGAMALATVALTILFVAVMDWGITSFLPAAIVYLALLGGLLTRFAIRRLPFIALFAVVLPTVLQVVFTRFFYIDLP